MALGKRSLMNEHMIAVLNKVHNMDPEPVQKSYLYYSQAEKEAVDYMIAIDLLTETTFEDEEGNVKKGYVLGEFGKEIVKDIILQPGVKYEATIYADAPDADFETNPQAYTITKQVVTSETTLPLRMARAGGFAVSLRAM